MGILRLATLPTRLHVPKYDWDEALQMDLEEALIEFKQLRLMGRDSDASGAVSISAMANTQQPS